MTGFWRQWMTGWCGAVVLFGVVLVAAALPGMEAMLLTLLGIMGDAPATVDPALRFAWSLMGALSIGWGLTLLAVVRAIDGLSAAAAAPVWRLTTVSVLAWYVVDSTLSVTSGFALNAGSNTLLLVGYLLPVLLTGVMGGRTAAA